MTEPELIKILAGHCQRLSKSVTVLEHIHEPTFPKLLFDELGNECAQEIVMSIHNVLVVTENPLCEPEKAIIKEVQTWDSDMVSPSLGLLRHCFLETELRSGQQPPYR